MGLPNGLITNRAARLPGTFRTFKTFDQTEKAEKPRASFDAESKTLRISVMVPWVYAKPYRASSPNHRSRSHWPRTNAIAAIKEATLTDARCIHSGDAILFSRATAQPVFHYTEERKRDADNALAMLKGAFDALVEAGIIPNDSPEHFTPKTPLFVKSGTGIPYVELIIEGEAKP